MIHDEDEENEEAAFKKILSAVLASRSAKNNVDPNFKQEYLILLCHQQQ